MGGLPKGSEETLKALNGFPMRVTYKDSDGSTTTITTLSLAEKSISADVFEVPKNYTGMNVPDQLLEMMKQQR